MLEEFLERRRAEREKVLAYLNELACRLRARWGRISLVLFGSYARGDFNRWSDIDVIIVSDHFADLEFPRRGAEMIEPIDAICWTPDEAVRMIKKDSWMQALRESVVIADDYGLFTKPQTEG